MLTTGSSSFIHLYALPIASFVYGFKLTELFKVWNEYKGSMYRMNKKVESMSRSINRHASRRQILFS